MDVRNLGGRFRLSSLFWIIGVVAYLLLNTNGKQIESGGGFSINGLETYEKYVHGFPLQCVTRIVDNRESKPWKFWDANEYEPNYVGIAGNLLVIACLVSAFVWSRSK